ncbi:MAG TPA: universal stress protein [Solirubrobacteraceae bacterium]|nr:universal stress protein [Solirubrobacteraceae bacterium]
MTSSLPQTGPALLCWDGSEAAAHAIRGAATLLEPPRQAVVVFAHFPPKAVLAEAGAVGAPTVSEEAAEDVLETGVRTAREAGFDATGVRIASTSTAAQVISDAAEQHDARLIVLGQARRSAINRYLLGSVAREILSAEHRPVVLVGSSDTAPAADPPVARDGRPVLICWDGSEGAARAIGDAAAIVGGARRATVLFAHVPTESARGILGGFSAPDAPIMGPADAEVLIEQGLRVAREAGFEASALPVIAERKTSEIIASTAEAEGALLITMGQRERSGIGTLLLGSVARGVLEADHRPVLLAGPGRPGVYPRSR